MTKVPEYPCLTPVGQKLCLSCLHLAYRLANKFRQAMGKERSEEVALYALATAAALFDPARGFQFTTYAYWRILGYLQRELTVLIRSTSDSRREFPLDHAPPARNCDPVDLAADRENAERAMQLLDRHLSKREAHAMKRRHLEGWTLQELADEWKVSRERVRQIEKRAIRKMRQALGGTR